MDKFGRFVTSEEEARKILELWLKSIAIDKIIIFPAITKFGRIAVTHFFVSNALGSYDDYEISGDEKTLVEIKKWRVDASQRLGTIRDYSDWFDMKNGKEPYVPYDNRREGFYDRIEERELRELENSVA